MSANGYKRAFEGPNHIVRPAAQADIQTPKNWRDFGFPALRLGAVRSQ